MKGVMWAVGIGIGETIFCCSLAAAGEDALLLLPLLFNNLLLLLLLVLVAAGGRGTAVGCLTCCWELFELIGGLCVDLSWLDDEHGDVEPLLWERRGGVLAPGSPGIGGGCICKWCMKFARAGFLQTIFIQNIPFIISLKAINDFRLFHLSYDAVNR